MSRTSGGGMVVSLRVKGVEGGKVRRGSHKRIRS